MLWRIIDRLVPGAFIRSRWRLLNDVYLYVAKKVYWQEEEQWARDTSQSG